MSRGEVRMVCFDAGGVLVRICRSWREGCQRAGVEYRAEPDAAHEISDRYQRGAMSDGEFFAAVSQCMAGRHSPEEVRAVHDAWIVEEYAGVAAVIDAIHASGRASTGLLSNTNPSHWAHRLMMGGPGGSAVSRVRHPHASHLLGLVKPDAEIYRAFETHTGFRPAEILFFDDLEANVVAARDLGWNAVEIDHRADTAAQITDALRSHSLL